MLRMIINADDLGFNEQVNQAVFELVEAGKVTSATILANAPATDEAVSRARYYPGCSFGIHLNLTALYPLCQFEELEPILDEAGQMKKELSCIQRLGLKPGGMRALYRELCTQTETLLDMGLNISHFDSHHHVHTLPSLFPLVKALQIKFKIPRIRLSKNLYTPQLIPAKTLRIQKAYFNWALSTIPPAITTDAFTEFDSFIQLDGMVPSKICSLEVMTHPGSPAHEEETRLLDRVPDLQRQGRVKLISYHNL